MRCRQAAREFTEARQEEVRLLDGGIHIIDMECRIREGSADALALESCLQRLRDIRAELTKGMRTGGGA